jgi:hypothetical protein
MGNAISSLNSLTFMSVDCCDIQGPKRISDCIDRNGVISLQVYSRFLINELQVNGMQRSKRIMALFDIMKDNHSYFMETDNPKPPRQKKQRIARGVVFYINEDFVDGRSTMAHCPHRSKDICSNYHCMLNHL